MIFDSVYIGKVLEAVKVIRGVIKDENVNMFAEMHKGLLDDFIGLAAEKGIEREEIVAFFKVLSLNFEAFNDESWAEVIQMYKEDGDKSPCDFDCANCKSNLAPQVHH